MTRAAIQAWGLGPAATGGAGWRVVMSLDGEIRRFTAIGSVELVLPGGYPRPGSAHSTARSKVDAARQATAEGRS